MELQAGIIRPGNIVPCGAPTLTMPNTALTKEALATGTEVTVYYQIYSMILFHRHFWKIIQNVTITQLKVIYRLKLAYISNTVTKALP